MTLYRNKSLNEVSNIDKYKNINLSQFDNIEHDIIDIEDFAKTLSISIELSEDIIKSGELINNKIIINSSEHPFRQNFTVAHEIGHFIKKHGDSDRDENKIYSEEERKNEREANQFAAELLVPEYKIIQEYDKVKNKKEEAILRDLSDIFCVSKKVIQFRLIDLNLVNLA